MQMMCVFHDAPCPRSPNRNPHKSSVFSMTKAALWKQKAVRMRPAVPEPSSLQKQGFSFLHSAKRHLIIRPQFGTMFLHEVSQLLALRCHEAQAWTGSFNR